MLIKMNFVGSLRTLCSEVLKMLSKKDISPTAQYHLYTRFKLVFMKVALLLDHGCDPIQMNLVPVCRMSLCVLFNA